MNLILIRHGESLANSKGEHQGREDVWSDTFLSNRGKDQAHKLAQRLKTEYIDTIYSSPLKRAYYTAKEINKFHGLDHKVDSRLAEKKDSESRDDLIERVLDFIKEVLNSHSNQESILIVSHGGINRAMIGISTGERRMGARLARKISQSNTGINRLEKDGSHYKIHCINSIDHLEPEEKIIGAFHEVQKIPFRFGTKDDRHKSEFLKEKLIQKGYDARKGIIIFDWKDLPISERILDVLQNSNTVDYREVAGVKIHGDFLMLDPAWPPYLSKAGFPVTTNWSGVEDTKQATNGELDFYKKDEFDSDKENILKEHGIHFYDSEYRRFKDRLNEWFKSFEE
ncbi:MAG: histidine phosphatase family protein [Candidatus Pacearchaeota archaeon]